MKRTFLILSAILTLISCNKRTEIETPKNPVTKIEKEEKIKEKYPSENFTECLVKGKQAFKAKYDFDAKKIIEVEENTKKENIINELINISEKSVILTHSDGRIIAEYQVLSKTFNQELDFFEYILEKDKEKCLFSHIVDTDGSYSYFQFRTKDSLNVYLKTQ